MTITDPFYLPYTMPDLSTRRAFFARVPSERILVGGTAVTEDLAHEGYPESSVMSIASVLSWLARNIVGGVRIEESGGTWQIGNSTFSVNVTASSALEVALLAAHTIADSKGVQH